MALSHAVQGLTGIHHAGGFHRDVKPDNLLLTTDEENKLIVKVSDFGLARTPFSITGTMTASPAGTEGYIAPEVRAGGRFTSSADIYSLGITGIEFLTGSRDRNRLPSSGAPQNFQLLLRSMTRTDPARRPNIKQISESFVGLLEHSDVNKIGADMVRRKGISPGWVLGGLALLGLLAGGEDKEWDRRVQRYRGPDGRFTSE
jgi:serine/threonine protein kinase